MELNETIRAKMRSPRSSTEMERRWKLARGVMKEAGLDLLLAQNDNQYIGGYVRWFIDVPAVQGYPMSVLFSADGEMTTITHGAPDMPLLPEWAMRGPTVRLSSPYVRSLNYTDGYDAALIAEQVKKRNVKRLGLVGWAQMNHVIVDRLREETDAELIDATRLIDEIKGPKSSEEMECICQTAAMHDQVMDYAAQIIRPGLREYEIQAALVKKLMELGSEEQLIMIGSAPCGQCAGIQYSHYQNRMIQRGDELTVMIETSGMGGYYCEMGRSFAVGCQPSEQLEYMFDQSRRVQHRTAELLVPGKRAGSVTEEVNVLLKEMGLPEEHRIFTHGQGYDLIESPGFDLEDDFILRENMNIAIHPTYATPHAFGFCCDNYQITAEGARRLEKFQQDVIRL